jgi:16S rRNA processing protein RimM
MSNLILLGRITAAHGIRGAVKIKSLTANPADIGTYGPLQTQSGSVIEIIAMKPANDEFIADLKNVKDRNAAEALEGTDLYISRDALPKPQAGEFYLHDLVGKQVLAEGKVLGIVTSIENYGAGDLMELDNGELIPVVFITETTDTISATLPPAYLDPPSKEDKHH